jgi:hypothetical protein
MNTVTTKNVQVGNVLVIDGHERKVIDIYKAWKTPEYVVTLQWTNSQKVMRSYHSNCKFSVLAKAVA